MCLTIEKNFFVCCNATGFHYANTNLGFRGPTCFFFLICCFAYQFVSFCVCLNNSVLKNIANASKGSCLKLQGNCYLSMLLQKVQVSESSEFVLPIPTQNLYMNI